jgi:hypothetical protein
MKRTPYSLVINLSFICMDVCQTQCLWATNTQPENTALHESKNLATGASVSLSRLTGDRTAAGRVGRQFEDRKTDG